MGGEWGWGRGSDAALVWSHLLDVDWLGEDLGRVLLLQLLQGGAEQHQHGRQLHLQGRLVNSDLQPSRCAKRKENKFNHLQKKQKTPGVAIFSEFDVFKSRLCISALNFQVGLAARVFTIPAHASVSPSFG